MAGESVTYSLVFSREAQSDLAKLKRSEPAAFKKASNLLKELMIHPFSGTGHPHPLKENLSGNWSRSITKKHRLVYRVEEGRVIVTVLAAYGHYDDK